MLPSFMASPMSPLSLSLPDMNAIWPLSLPPIMSSQSGEAIVMVRSAAGAGPELTVQVPSLMTACHVPPSSPPISYWMVLLRPAAFAALNLEGIRSKVSFTLGIRASLWCDLESEEIHPARHGEHRSRDVAGTLRAEERD